MAQLPFRRVGAPKSKEPTWHVEAADAFSNFEPKRSTQQTRDGIRTYSQRRSAEHPAFVVRFGELRGPRIERFAQILHQELLTQPPRPIIHFTPGWNQANLPAGLLLNKSEKTALATLAEKVQPLLEKHAPKQLPARH